MASKSEIAVCVQCKRCRDASKAAPKAKLLCSGCRETMIRGFELIKFHEIIENADTHKCKCCNCLTLHEKIYQSCPKCYSNYIIVL